MFLPKFDILINKQARPITNFNNEVTKLPSGDDITRFDGIQKSKSLEISATSGKTCFIVQENMVSNLLCNIQ
jgi:hypothetical protein